MISVSFNLFYQGFLRVRQNYFKGSQGVLLKIFKRLQSFLAVLQNTAIQLLCIDTTMSSPHPDVISMTPIDESSSKKQKDPREEKVYCRKEWIGSL